MADFWQSSMAFPHCLPVSHPLLHSVKMTAVSMHSDMGPVADFLAVKHGLPRSATL